MLAALAWGKGAGTLITYRSRNETRFRTLRPEGSNTAWAELTQRGPKQILTWWDWTSRVWRAAAPLGCDRIGTAPEGADLK